MKKAINYIVNPFMVELWYIVREASDRPNFLKPPQPKPDDRSSEYAYTVPTDNIRKTMDG